MARKLVGALSSLLHFLDWNV